MIKSYTKVVVIFLTLIHVASVYSATNSGSKYLYQKEFDELTQAEHTKAKRTALKTQMRPLVACADPGNMPISNMKGEGFDNLIIKALAEYLNTELSFFWRPYIERGIHRETFDNKECDLLLGMPHGYNEILTTIPIYRTTYVFAYHEDKDFDINSLNDSILGDLKIGTYQHSGLREALSHRGLTANIDVHVIRQDTDLVPEHQQWNQVMKVVDGSLDIAGVWGPFAGYVKSVKKAPIVIQPVNLMEDRTPLEFSLSIGMRKNDVLLKYALDNAILESADKIDAILREYGVPLVSCSDCAVQGDLPSHGSYYERFIDEAKRRYLEPVAEEQRKLDVATATEDQIVDQEKLEAWLEEGADIDMELQNAVVASDPVRVRFLVQKGANINHLNDQGYGLLHNAARYRDSDILKVLLELGADTEVKDLNGWTALMHAAFMNHVPSINALIDGGADLEAKSKKLYTALSIAIGERKFWAATALLDSGANINSRTGIKELTPLMLVARHLKSKEREKNTIEGIEPVELARKLIESGSDVNAITTEGETALMYAAAHDNSPVIALLFENGADPSLKSKSGHNALDIAEENRNDSAIKSLKLFSLTLNNKKANES